MENTATAPRFYAARVAQGGGWQTRGGSGDWYVVDRTTDQPVTWVGFKTKTVATAQANDRNAR